MENTNFAGKQERIDTAEKQHGANNPREISQADANFHPGAPLYFTIDREKLEEVTRIFNQWQPDATEELIEAEICADWHEGDEHQAWIDSARPLEVADWLASFVEW